jgi:hypothetical protein
MAEGEQVQYIPLRNDGTWDDRRSLTTAIIRHPNRFHLGVGSDYTVTRGGSQIRGSHATHRAQIRSHRLAHDSKSGELPTPHYYKPIQIEMQFART